MAPEFRNAERITPSLPWDEWRKQARRIFLGAFHRSPHLSDADHAACCFHEWADEVFQVDFENGLTPSAACKRYFADRRAPHDDDQNDPL